MFPNWFFWLVLGFPGYFSLPSFVWLVFPFDISSLGGGGRGGGVFFIFMNGKRIKAFRESQREEKIYRFVDFGEIFFCYFSRNDGSVFIQWKQTNWIRIDRGGGGGKDQFSFLFVPYVVNTKLSIGLTY